MKFGIFQFQRPSACFSVEVSCENNAASGLRQQAPPPQNHTLLVAMTEVRLAGPAAIVYHATKWIVVVLSQLILIPLNFHVCHQDFRELLRIWGILVCARLSPEAQHSKVAQRLATCVQLEFGEEGRLARAAFDHAAFALKNRSEIASLVAAMATRMQAAARRFLVCRRLHFARSRVAALPAVLPSKGLRGGGVEGGVPASSPRSSGGKRRKKKTKSAKGSALPSSPTSRRSTSSSPRGRSRGSEEERVTVSRALFAQHTPSQEDHLLHSQFNYHDQQDQHQKDQERGRGLQLLSVRVSDARLS